MPDRPKVLLVDSSPFCLDQMALFLKSSRVEILRADTAAEALRQAEEHLPRLIFMAMTLPDRSGIECCWQFKQIPKLERSHIVLITPGSRREDSEACQAAKCSAVLSKPLHRRSFLHVGRELLTSIDRRESRIPCRATVACRHQEITFYGTIEDISPHGMFVGSPQPIGLGETIRMRFLLPRQEATLIDTTAAVTWLNQGKKSKLPRGFGVEFDGLSPRATAQIADFLDSSHTWQHPPDDW